MAKRAYHLTHSEPNSVNPDSKELSNVIITRMGLSPRKIGSTDKMYRVLIELYERIKLANKEKKPVSSSGYLCSPCNISFWYRFFMLVKEFSTFCFLE